MVVRGTVCCTTNCALKKSSKCNYHLHILYFVVMIFIAFSSVTVIVTVAV